MASRIRTALTASFAAISTLLAACGDKQEAPKQDALKQAAPVSTEVTLPTLATRTAVAPAALAAAVEVMSKGFIDSTRPLVNGVDDRNAGVGRYAARVLGVTQEQEFMEVSRRMFEDQPDSRLSIAVRNAMETQRVQVYGAGGKIPEERLSRIEYAALVYPQGGGQVIVRQYMGDMNNPQPLSDNAVLNNNGALAKHGVAPLTSKLPGYRTIFAADIDAKGGLKVIPNPEKLDVKAYGIDDAFSPAPREPVDSPAQRTSATLKAKPANLAIG